MWNGFPVVTGCTHDIAEGGAMPPPQRRQHHSRDGGAASMANERVQPGSICSELCTALEAQKDQLCRREEELRSAEKACKNALERIQKEQDAWIEKIEIVRMRLQSANEKRREAKMMLKLHGALEKSGDIIGTMRTVERIVAEGSSSGVSSVSADAPRSALDVRQPLVDERLTEAQGEASAAKGVVLQFDERDTKECTMCKADFSTESFMLIKPKEKCRHTIRPCGHFVCGKCARQLWGATKRCPVCSREMTKKPKFFRPVRYQ